MRQEGDSIIAGLIRDTFRIVAAQTLPHPEDIGWEITIPFNAPTDGHLASSPFGPQLSYLRAPYARPLSSR